MAGHFLRWLLIVAWVGGFGYWVWSKWFSPDPWLAKNGICLRERENHKFSDQHFSGDKLSHYKEFVPVLCNDPAREIGAPLGGYDLRLEIRSRSENDPPVVDVSRVNESDGMRESFATVPSLQFRGDGSPKFIW
jgi:hypothetical protein